MRKTRPASRLADPIRFLRFAGGRNTRKQDPFEKSRFGPFRGEYLGIQKRWLEKVTSKSQFEA